MKATSTEENNQVIQNSYDAPGTRDTDALPASMQKGDPQEQDRRVLRTIIFHHVHGFGNDCCRPVRDFSGMAPFLATPIVGDMDWLYSFVLCRGASLHLGTWSLKSWRAYRQPVLSMSGGPL